MECEEFCHLFSSVVENLNLEHIKHVSSIKGAVKTWRHVTVRQTGVLPAPVSVQCLNMLYSPLQVNNDKSITILELPSCQTDMHTLPNQKPVPIQAREPHCDWLGLGFKTWSTAGLRHLVQDVCNMPLRTSCHHDDVWQFILLCVKAIRLPCAWYLTYGRTVT